ncbi:hypothetical protein SESBI_04242 [Sesbania bispinosa]|nr:hypothetical protein SESBI_04242 [Sesbania bispinosa]
MIRGLDNFPNPCLVVREIGKRDIHSPHLHQIDSHGCTSTPQSLEQLLHLYAPSNQTQCHGHTLLHQPNRHDRCSTAVARLQE